MGDRILVVSPRQEVDRIVDYFGDSLRALSETDYLSLSLGIVIGVFLGMLPMRISSSGRLDWSSSLPPSEPRPVSA
jgi:putative transport protein